MSEKQNPTPFDQVKAEMPMNDITQHTLYLNAIDRAEKAEEELRTGVKVKPLNWVEGAPGTYKEVAESPFGHYSVWEINGTACWSPWKAGSGSIVDGGINGAKAAAQADFEQRILSSLSPQRGQDSPPSPVPREETP